jgi:anti-anti-sigma regulatory factor
MTTSFRATISSDQSGALTLAIAGSLNEAALGEIALLIDHGRRDHGRIILDLSEVTLLDRAAAQFLNDQFRSGVGLVNCPVYLRRWILKDANENESEE